MSVLKKKIKAYKKRETPFPKAEVSLVTYGFTGQSNISKKFTYAILKKLHQKQVSPKKRGPVCFILLKELYNCMQKKIILSVFVLPIEYSGYGLRKIHLLSPIRLFPIAIHYDGIFALQLKKLKKAGKMIVHIHRKQVKIF